MDFSKADREGCTDRTRSKNSAQGRDALRKFDEFKAPVTNYMVRGLSSSKMKAGLGREVLMRWLRSILK
jgi:hypothetical protein